ncbi:hypothetical protein ACLOJK_031890 [Asimina triloba]
MDLAFWTGSPTRFVLLKQSCSGFERKRIAPVGRAFASTVRIIAWRNSLVQPVKHPFQIPNTCRLSDSVLGKDLHKDSYIYSNLGFSAFFYFRAIKSSRRQSSKQRKKEKDDSERADLLALHPTESSKDAIGKADLRCQQLFLCTSKGSYAPVDVGPTALG